jgi:hypothetical protein
MAIWIYTLVFAFSSLWFTHYCLSALHALRVQRAASSVAVDAALPPVPAPQHLEVL